MILFIILTLLGTIGLSLLFILDKNLIRKKFTFIKIIIMASISSIIISFILILVSTLVFQEFTKYEIKVVSSTKIVSLQNAQNISASFFLGSGKIKTDTDLIIWKYNEDTSIQKIKIPFYKIKIYETVADSGYEYYNTHRAKAIPNFYSFAFLLDDILIYKFYLKKNTIKKSYKLN